MATPITPTEMTQAYTRYAEKYSKNCPLISEMGCKYMLVNNDRTDGSKDTFIYTPFSKLPNEGERTEESVSFEERLSNMMMAVCGNYIHRTDCYSLHKARQGRIDADGQFNTYSGVEIAVFPGVVEI